MKIKEVDIENEISDLERQLESCINNDKEALVEQLRVKKKELENIIEYKTKGGLIRSKARWYNEGEKNNKYFLNLENHHCKKKTIMQIKAKDGASLTNDSDILRECNSVYSDLYATKSTKITGDLEKNFLAVSTRTNSTRLIRKNARAPYLKENVSKLSSQWNPVNHLVQTVSLLNSIRFSGKMYLRFL